MCARATRSLPCFAARTRLCLSEPYALHRDAVGERMVVWAAVGFEAVGQGVHPRPRRDRRRHCHGELGVADADPRHHLGVEDHLLGRRRLVGDDAGATHLGARARRRGHSDDRHDALRLRPGPPVAHVLEVPQRMRLPGHEGDHLAGVERRSAAHRDHAVVAALPQHFEAGLHVGSDGIGLHFAEQGRGEALALQRLERALHEGKPSKLRIGNEQRTRHGRRFHRCAQLRDAPCPKPHRRWIVPVADELHGCLNTARSRASAPSR